MTEQKPKWIEENILNEVKLGIKHLKLVVQKDLLETCLRKRLYPDEIKSIAKRIIGQYGGNNTEKMIKKEEQRLMKFRIRLKQEQIMTAKNNWTKMTRMTKKSAQLSSDRDQRMRTLVKTELELQWEFNKSKMKAKIEKFNNLQKLYQM